MRFPPILLALALAACASTPQGTQSQLTGLIELPSGTSQAIRLPATLRYTGAAAGAAAGGKDHQYYLVAGTYRPYKYNQSGTFYLGEQPAVVERSPAAPGPDSALLRIGGIWIPADPAAAPRLFIVPDYYKRLADGAPLPHQMSQADLAEFRHQAPAQAYRPPFIYVPAVVPGTLRAISPLQAGLAAGAIAGVLVLLNEPGASRELVFAGAEMADPDSIRQIRTAFPSALR